MVITVFVANLVLDFWLLVILHKQGAWKRLPWFVFYMAWGFFFGCIALATYPVSPRLYAAAYWWLEGVDVVLIVGAMRESFLRIFEGFTSKPGFRWSFWVVIAAVLV